MGTAWTEERRKKFKRTMAAKHKKPTTNIPIALLPDRPARQVTLAPAPARPSIPIQVRMQFAVEVVQLLRAILLAR